MDNSINFKGAIWLKQPSEVIKRDILPILGKHRQIFNNFTPEGDVLYITRKGRDRSVAEFLTHRRADFMFYPSLSTKSGFNDEMPEAAKEIISKCGEKPLTRKGQLAEHFKLRTIAGLSTNKKNNIELSMKALGFNKEEQVIKKKNGFSEIRDKEGKLLAKVSDPGRYGISFAYVEPKNADESPLRYAIKGDEIIFQYTSESGRNQFLKNYNSAVKANKRP